MITLKLNTYKKNEAIALQNIFEEALEKHMMKSDCDNDCRECPYNRMCYDLNHAIEYLNGYIDGRDGK